MFYGLMSWRWFKRLSLLILLITLGGPLVYAIWTSSTGNSELAAYVKYLDETDPGWQMADIYRERNQRIKALPTNSWDHVEKVMQSLPKNWEKATIEIDDGLSKLSFHHLPYINTVDALVDVVQDNRESLRLARGLENQPVGGRYHEMPADPIGFLLTDIQQCREVMRLLSLASHEAAVAGRIHECPSLIIAALNTSRAIGDEPITISQLVRMAGRSISLGMLKKALALGELEDAALARIQQEYTAEADVNLLSICFRGERAFNHRVMEMIADGGIDASGLAAAMGPPTMGQRLTGYALKIYLPSNRKVCLESMTQYLEISKKPFDEQWKLMKLQEDQGKKTGLKNFYVRLLLPATQKVAEAGLRSRGELLAVATGIACERFRLRHNRWPQSLAEIPKAHLPTIPTDPFTGRPIAYNILPDGVVIYSLGPDEKDDGGKVGMDQNLLTDFGIKLFNKPLRRADPPEPELPEIPDDPDEPLDPFKIGGPDQP